MRVDKYKKSATIAVKVYPSTDDAIERAATAAGITKADWIRETLADAAGKEIAQRSIQRSAAA